MLSESRELLALAAILKARSRALIESSRSRIMSSRERLVGQRPRISGGIDSRLEESEVRQRVRALLSRGVLPGIRPQDIQGEQSARPQDCTICGVKTGTDEGGFELPPPNGVVVVVHRRCFDIWCQEAALRLAEPHRV